MSVSGRVVKPTTRRGKRTLQKREPQVIEDPKRALFLKGRKTSELVRRALKDVYQMKKPDALMFAKRNDITVFEDPTPLERHCKKNECAHFLLGSHSKKRPNNLTIGRMFNYALLDMVELHIESYKSLMDFIGPKMTLGIKSCLLFNGPQWDESDDLKMLRSIFIDFFHIEQIDVIRLQGIEHTLSFSVTPASIICLRSYKVLLKKSGLSIPRVELEEIGPRIDFSLRRTKPASPDLMKEACKKARELIPHKKRNISMDVFGTTHGRIHVGKQEILRIQTRKLKGLKKTGEEKWAKQKKLKVLEK
ncbi:hypothetical protein HUJ04_011354 [Dendroctonus ponderosae]